jgi:hypothetical protein
MRNVRHIRVAMSRKVYLLMHLLIANETQQLMGLIIEVFLQHGRQRVCISEGVAASLTSLFSILRVVMFLWGFSAGRSQ